MDLIRHDISSIFVLDYGCVCMYYCLLVSHNDIHVHVHVHSHCCNFIVIYVCLLLNLISLTYNFNYLSCHSTSMCQLLALLKAILLLVEVILSICLAIAKLLTNELL